MDFISGGTGGDKDTLRPVYQMNTGNKKSYISIIEASNQPLGFTVTNEYKKPSSVFTLKFKNIGNGATFVLPSGGVLSDAAMNATKEAFSLRFKTGKGGQGDFLNTAEFEVIDGDYRPNSGK